MSKIELKSINNQLDQALFDISRLQTKNSIQTEDSIMNRDERIAEQLIKLEQMINKHRGFLSIKA